MIRDDLYFPICICMSIEHGGIWWIRVCAASKMPQTSTDLSRMFRPKKLWDQSKTNGVRATKHEAMPTNSVEN